MAAKTIGGAFIPGSGPAVRLRAVAFVDALGEAGDEEMAEPDHEIIQRLAGLVIVAFGSAEAAARTCASLPGDVRAGVSCGDVLYDNGALHGLPVIEASRLRDIATPGQILCAERLVRAGDLPDSSFRRVGPIEIRGLPKPLSVCELIRTGSPASSRRGAPRARPASRGRVR